MFHPDYQTRVVDRIFDSPDLYVPMIDEEKEAALVIPMTRETYSKSVFLDWRSERAAHEAELVPMRSLIQAFRSRKSCDRPLRYIFHPAFAGSTLLCRCIDVPGVCLPYKEPSMLLQISIDRRNSFLWNRPGSPVLSMDLALALLGRSYSSTEEVVIKPADACVILAREMLSHSAESAALYLNLNLEDFVVTMLKHPDRREFVRNNLARTDTDLAILSISLDIDSSDLEDSEAAAYVWYGLMVHYLDVLKDDDLKARSLNASTFYLQPRETLKALADFFDLNLTDVQIDKLVSENVFARDSKDPSIRRSASQRTSEQIRLREELGSEIRDAHRWIERNTEAFPIPEQLPRPLL